MAGYGIRSNLISISTLIMNLLGKKRFCHLSFRVIFVSSALSPCFQFLLKDIFEEKNKIWINNPPFITIKLVNMLRMFR